MEYILSRPDIILKLIGQHLFMTLSALLISIGIALPLSMVLLRSERVASAVLGVLGVLYTIPSIALLILLLPLFGLNQNSVIVALIIYTQIILVRNMIAGLRSVPPATLEAATGVGMSSWQRWYRVQLPLALPVILAGIRLATIVAISIATIGAKFGAGGLGTLLFDGIAQNRYDKIVAGAVVVGLLALLLNRLLLFAETRFDPLKHMELS
ncbi:MAG: ABC transporter permease [Ardenticatenaceae bacterium]|nr:ABC transporter permease [Ardenticatenaceae bacterium]